MHSHLNKKIISTLLILIVFFSFLGFASKSEAAIARVQFISSANAGATTVSAVWPSTTTAGNLLTAIVTVRGGSGTTITPPSGGWTLATRANNTTTISTAIYYIANATSQSGTSSWGISPSARATLTLAEYSGAATSSVLDQVATSTGSSSTGSSGTTPTTIQTNEVAIAGISANNSGRTFSAQTNSFTAVSSVNSGGGPGGNATVFEEKVLSATGAQSVNATISSSSTWAGAIATFKAKLPPIITNVTSSLADGSYKVGQVIPIQITFDQSVTVVGTPQLTLTTGTPATTAINYSSGSPGTTLTFNYTVATGNTSADLDYAATTSLTLNGGTINATSGGLAATLTLVSPGSVGSLGANKNIIIDTTAPTNQDTVFVTSTSKVGGATVTVVSAGETGGAIWFAPSGTTTFVAGTTMTTAGGIATSIFAPATAGAYRMFVIDAAGNISTQSTAILTVDNTAPTAAITYSINHPVKTGDSQVITATFSEPIADAPIMKIAISGSNTLAATNMTKVDTTHYTYTHTVGSGDGTATVALSVGTDLAGNVITAAPTSGATFVVDNTNPTSTITSPANNSSTNSTTVALTGTSSDTNLSSTTISVDGGSFVATSGTAAAWTYSATSLSQGAHTFQSKATDTAGNTGLSTIVNVTIDSVAPTAAITYSINHPVKTGDSQVITATFSEPIADAPIMKIAISGSNTLAATNMTKVDTTHYTYTHTVGSGDGTATVALSVGTDLAGNVITAAPTSGATFVVDNTAPTNQDTVFASSIFKTGGSSVSIVSSGDATNTIWFAPSGTTTFIAGATMTTAGGTATNILAPATNGTYRLFVIDEAGNISSPSIAILTVGNTYTLTYIAGANGSIIGTTPQTVNSGSDGSLVTATPDSEYHFTSWSDGVLTASRTDTNVIANISVTASFAINTYTVTFNSNGGSAVSAITGVPYNTTITLPTAPTKTGYTFNGWFTDDSTFLNAFTGSTAVVADITVYAKWTANTIPTLSPVHIESNNLNISHAKTGDIVTLTFTSSESIPTPTVTIAGQSSVVTGGPTSWSSTHTMLITDTEGIVPFTIDFTNLLNDPATQVVSTTDASSVTFDRTAPIVSEVTPVPTPTANPIPSYTFNTNESGAITYGGDCSSAVTSATSGNNTIMFNSLSNGPHSNCTISITDASGNISNTLTVSPFTIASATKFVIINPTDNTVGNNVTVTIQAQDASSGVVSSYNNNVTLIASGGATGAGLVNIVNGVGTIDISDHVAETVNLSLSDTASTGLDISSTQDVIFSVGALHHFSFANISSPEIAGSNINTTITANDAFGNTVSSFIGTVNFSTTAGTITPAVSNNFVGGALTQNVIVTQSGASKTITATRTGGSETGTSNSFVVNSGSTAKFILNNPGDMSTGTRIGYTVTRKDINDNLVTTGSDTVYLYTTSGVTSAFYDTATDGGTITSISIPDSQSSSDFWYFDDNVGTWTITASDSASSPNGATGIIDSTDSITVSSTPIVPTKFIIDVASSAISGDTVIVSVKAVDNSGNLDTAYNRIDSSLTLKSTGNSTAKNGLSFTVNNGVGTINITDNTAETITLSLIDSNPDVPPLTLTTSDILFLAGPVDHFIIDNITSPQAAGNSFSITITAKDLSGNTATSFNSTVDFSTTAGIITPTISNNFLSGILTQNISVTGSGTGKTITVTKTGDIQSGTSNSFDINPGVVSSFLVEANGGGNITTQTTNVPFDIKITARDSFGNTTTGFTGTANITSSGTLSAGNGTTASFTSGVLNTHSVTISNGGSFTITATHTGGSETGVSNSFIVSPNAIVATKFIIINPTDVQVGQSTTVVIKAVDALDNIDSTFQGNIMLVTSGNATGGGLVNIINGVGSKIITDTTAEVINLSLGDIVPPTTLDFTATENVTFSALPPVVSGGGGGGVSTPTISFTGLAFPQANVGIMAIRNGQAPVSLSSKGSSNGNINISYSGELPVNSNSFVLVVYDKNKNIAQTKIITLGTNNQSNTNVLMAPTVSLNQQTITKGTFMGITGQAMPNYKIEMMVDGVKASETTTTFGNGNYNLTYNTYHLSVGEHTLRVRQVSSQGKVSDYSIEKSFYITNSFLPKADLNNDGKVDVQDLSIFMNRYHLPDANKHLELDLNNDGKVDITDLSLILGALTH